MLRVNGLYGHIQRNNTKVAILIATFLLLFMAIQSTVRMIPYMATDKIHDALGVPLADPSSPFGGVVFAPISSSLETPSANGRGRRMPTAGQSVVEPPPLRSITVVPWQRRLVAMLTDTWSMLLLGFALLYLASATWWNSLYIRYALRAKPLARRDFPDLYNLVENLAMSAGLPCPSIELIDSPRLNAYASGLTPSAARLGMTTGLVDKLDRHELEAVVAHELTHLRYGDSRLMAVTKACVDLVLPAHFRIGEQLAARPIATTAFLLYLLLMLGVKLMAMVALIIAVITLTTYVVKATVLHAREFVADAGAIELTKNPAALISALRKIDGSDDLAIRNLSTQAMMFSGSSSGLFSTHPPLDERIAAIRLHGGVRVEDQIAHVARRTSIVAKPQPMAQQQPSFGRRRVVQGLSGTAPQPVAAGIFAVSSMPLDVRREAAVFTSGQADLAAQYSSGGTLFERWIMTGRAAKAGNLAKAVLLAPLRLMLYLQAAVAIFVMALMLLLSLALP